MRTSNMKQRDGQTPDTGCGSAMGISRHSGMTEEQTGIPGGHGNSTSDDGTGTASSTLGPGINYLFGDQLVAVGEAAVAVAIADIDDHPRQGSSLERQHLELCMRELPWDGHKDLGEAVERKSTTGPSLDSLGSP